VKKSAEIMNNIFGESGNDEKGEASLLINWNNWNKE
jgi:hypothetical protein